jgi:DNA-binding response OmpR family regulator
MNESYQRNRLLETSPSEILRHARSLVENADEELDPVSQDRVRSRGRSSRILFITPPQGELASVISTLICGQGMSLDIVDRYDQCDPDSVYDRLATLKYDLLIPSNLELSPMYIPDLVSHAREKHSEVKILVISGWDSPGFLHDLTARGIHDYALLPMRAADLQKRIFKLLSRCSDQAGHDTCSLHPDNG